MEYSRIARTLRQRIARFSGELSEGLPKVARRLVGEALYGIQASQSVVLTKMARTLEEPIRVKKTEERLSRQLSREGLARRVEGNLLRLASDRVGRDTLLILDPSDLAKPYAKRMEYLATVRDGSTGEMRRGYWYCQVVATEVSGEGIVPLVQRVWSADAPGFVSENRQLLRIMDTVMDATGKRGIWVIDRGGDREHLYVPMLRKGYRFLVRMVGTRHLVHGGRMISAHELAKSCKPLYAETVVRVGGAREKAQRIEFGYQRVRLPERGEELSMVVVRGFGEEPLMLLTTEPVRRNRKVLWRIVRAYMRRWAVEETIRFIKQSYEIEDVRVLGYRSLRNLMALVCAAAYFAAAVLDGREKLRVMAGYVARAAKRVFGVPEFACYAVADGLMSIFARYPGRITPLAPISSGQGILLFDGS